MFKNPGLDAATIGALSLLGCLGTPPSADASTSHSSAELPTRPHIELIASEPTDGDTLAAELERIRLVFSGTVEEALSEIRLVGPLGLDLSLQPSLDPTMDRALVAAVPPLAPGAYRVAWRTVSVDGHAVSGSFVFFVPLEAPADGESPTGEADDAGDGNGAAASDGAMDGSRSSPDAASRFEPPPADSHALGVGVPPSLALSRGVAVATLLALGGLLAIIVWVAPGRSRRASRLAYLLAFLLPALLVLHLFFWLRSVSPGDALDLDAIPALLGTRAGGLELLRLGLAVAALATLAFGRHLGSAAFLTLLATLVSGATGHALSTDPAISVPAKAAHLAAAQYWLGGLLYLIVEAGDSADYRTTARRVSRIAVFAVITIAGTGIIQTLAALPPVAVFTTAYGRLVLAKAAGLAVLSLLGFRNQFSLLPALEEGTGGGRLRRSVVWEVLVMALVFVLAALLAYVPPTT